MKLYAIKPLKWEVIGMRGQPIDTVRAETAFGSITVMVDEEVKRWRFTWCFQEYYDEGTSEKSFRDVKTAKFAAEAFYQGRLKKALTSKVVN